VPYAYTAAATRTLVHVYTAARTGKPYTKPHLQGCDLRCRRFCSTGKVLELAQVRCRGVKSRYLSHDLQEPAEVVDICTYAGPIAKMGHGHWSFRMLKPRTKRCSCSI